MSNDGERMRTPVYIGLLDRNSFLVQGLMFFLVEYFNSKHKKAVFVDKSQVDIADIIFYEPNHAMTYFIGKVLRSSMRNTILFSLDKGKNSFSTWRLARSQQVLSKKENLQQLRSFLDALWREREASDGKKQTPSLEEELTCRQRQIMRLLAKGIAPADISARLNISVKTVSSHRGAVMKKFGFNRKIELYNWLILRGNEL